MANTTVPRSDAELATCLDAVRSIAAAPRLNATVAALIRDEFDPVAAAYDAARTAGDAAALRAARSTDAKNAADATFTEAFRAWLFTVYADLGERAALAELKPLLGHLAPGRFLHRPPRTRLERMPRLDLFVREQPGLAGDVQRYAVVRDAAARLEGAVAAWEAALKDQVRRVQARKDATVAIRGAYGLVVRTVQRLHPDHAPLIPRFHRADRAPAPAVCEMPQPMTPTLELAPAPVDGSESESGAESEAA
jgi:hypothetical protein